MQNKWVTNWNSLEHIESKKRLFHDIDQYIKDSPNKILDIGCGLARESEFFQKKYACELYLLDGDFENTKSNTRDVK